MEENAQGFVGDIPVDYDRGLGPVLFTDYAREMARRVADLVPARVLETAAGTGIVTEALRDAVPAATTITSTDLNDDMLVVSRGKFQSTPSVVIETADALDLPYDDGEFDVVVCSFGVMFYPDKPRSFEEVHRVLRPGGHYLFCVWDGYDANPFARVTDTVVDANFPDDPPPFYRVPCGFGATFVDSFQAMLIDAGFDDVLVETIQLNPEVASWDEFARGIIFGNPILNQIRSRADVTPDEVRAAVAAGLEAEFGPAPAAMPLQAIFYRARRTESA